MGTTGLYHHTGNRAADCNSLAVEGDVDDLVPRAVFHIVVVGRVILVGDRDIGSLVKGREVQLDGGGLDQILGDDVVHIAVVVHTRCQSGTQGRYQQAIV